MVMRAVFGHFVYLNRGKPLMAGRLLTPTKTGERMGEV